MTFVINPPFRGNEGSRGLVTVYDIFFGIVFVRLTCEKLTKWTGVSFRFMAKGIIHLFMVTE